MKAKLLIVALLACLVFDVSSRRLERSFGVDFYHYWAAQRIATLSTTFKNSRIDNPYQDERGCAKALNAYVNRSEDEKLKSANRQHRKMLRLTGTPVFYAALGFLPEDYSTAFSLYYLLQHVCFIGAILVLGIVHRVTWFESGVTSLLLTLVNGPFLADTTGGNSNAIQLFQYSLIAWFAVRLTACQRSTAIRTACSTLFLFAVGALALFKPNLAAVTLLLTLHLLATQGLRVGTLAAVGALVACLALAVVPCLYYHSWTVWQDWYRVLMPNADAPVEPRTNDSNASVIPLVSQLLQIGKPRAAIVVASLLTASGLGALAWAKPRGVAIVRWIWRGGLQVLRDPHIAMAMGAMVLFALSPLVWLHYYTLALLPALWLLWGQPRWRPAAWAGLLSIFVVSDSGVLDHLGAEVQNVLFALSWLPLWIGTLAAIVTLQTAGADQWRAASH